MAEPQWPSFAVALLHYRRAAALTQEELAEQAGLSVRSISNLERGSGGVPRPDTVRRLAAALRLSDRERASLIAVAAHIESTDPDTERGESGFLPRSPHDLIGRDREMDLLAGTITAGTARLITLTGPGGIGKTRLALEVSRAVQSTFEDGAHFVSLSAVTRPDGVAPAIVGALGLREASGSSPPRVLLDRLRERHLLLLLDNFEHVVEAAPLISELLAECPHLTVLTTSRVPLRLQAEHEVPVGPLDLPLSAPSTAEPDLAQSPAVMLFVQRARAVVPEFTLTEENADAVLQICRDMDGLPLAIELAAARLKLLSPAALQQRLARPLQILTGGARDLPDRHQTMRKAIDSSYELLTDTEQTLFRRLAVFVGPWTIDAADEVCTVPGDPRFDMLDGLSALFDSSMLFRADPEPEPSFRMLAVLREYAAERLAASGEEEIIRERHASYYESFAAASSQALIGPGAGDWLDRVEQQYANVRAVLTHLRDTQNLDRLMRMTVHLWPFWYRRGWHGEARVWLESALAGGTSDDLTLRAEALRILGAVLNVLGETTAAREPAAEALQIYRRLGNHAFASACLRTLGWTSLLQRDLDEARQLYAEALDEARAAGETVDISASILGLAAIADDADEPEQAVAYATEGLELARRTEAVSLVAEGLLQRSSGLLAAGQAREALPALEEGLDVARSLGHRRYQVHFLSYLSVAHLLLGDSDRSAAYGRECLSHASELADSYLIAYGLEGVALAATAGKDFRRAAVLWGAASRIRGAATITPFTRRLYDRYQRDVLAQLGRRQFEESWKVGEAMQRDDAVSCALEESSEDAP